MSHRRTLVAAAGLLLAVPTFSSCGFDYATDRVNTIGAGVSEREELVDVLGVAVISGERGSGNLIGGLSNNDQEEPDALVGIGGEVTASEFAPVELTPGGYVNLEQLIHDGEAIEVSGDFVAGDFVEIVFEFEDSEPVTLNVPVDKPCYKYEGLAPGGDSVGDSTEPPETAEPSTSGDDGDTYECASLVEGVEPSH